MPKSAVNINNCDGWSFAVKDFFSSEDYVEDGEVVFFNGQIINNGNRVGTVYVILKLAYQYAKENPFFNSDRDLSFKSKEKLRLVDIKQNEKRTYHFTWIVPFSLENNLVEMQVQLWTPGKLYKPIGIKNYLFYETKWKFAFEKLRKGKQVSEPKGDEKQVKSYAEKEYSVLSAIYNLSEGIANELILIKDLEREFNFSYSELSAILNDLEGRKHLIGSIEHAVWIVPAGIEEIEKSKKHPEQPTNNFPANIFYNTFNAPVAGIQQGGEGNTQNIAQNINPDFTQAIEQLLVIIDSSSLSPIQKISAKSDVQTIKDLAALEKSPEVLQLANSKIEAVKEIISMTADMTSLGIVLIPIIQAFFGS